MKKFIISAAGIAAVTGIVAIITKAVRKNHI